MGERYLHDNKAGNLHDVWKHFILSEYMQIRSNKNKNITYIDTHCGNFVYRNSQYDQLKSGLLNKANFIENLPSSIYKELLNIYKTRFETDESGLKSLLYPGSLALATYLLMNTRSKIIGCDTNEQVTNKCKKNMKIFKRATNTQLFFECHNLDGFEFAFNILNDKSKAHSVIFVDPPYYPSEKEDWEKLLKLIDSLLTSPNNNTLVMWYCIYSNDLDSNMGYLLKLLNMLNTSKVIKALNVSLQIQPLTQNYKKSITGIIIINPKISRFLIVKRLMKSGIMNLAFMLLPSDSPWVSPRVNFEFLGSEIENID